MLLFAHLLCMCYEREVRIHFVIIQNFFSEAIVRRCSVKKGVFKNFAKFIGKHLCQSLFFNKVAGLKPETLLKNRPWHKWFPINFIKFLRTTFFTEHLRWLLLLFHLTQRKLLSFRCGKKNVM